MDQPDSTFRMLVSSIEKLETQINKRFDDLRADIRNTDERHEKRHECHEERLRKMESCQSSTGLVLKIIGTFSTLAFAAALAEILKTLGGKL